MSIMGNVYTDIDNREHRMPDWVKAERYEYCEDFYDEYASRRAGILSRIATLLLAAF